MAKVYEGKIADLQLDQENANEGTERGAAVLEISFRENGAGRSIVLDRENRVIGGNKSTETAVAVGLEDVIIVETDGTKLVAVKRTDLDLADPDDHRARMLAYMDNRASELNLSWVPSQILADLHQDRPLDLIWQPKELDRLLSKIQLTFEGEEPAQQLGAGYVFEQPGPVGAGSPPTATPLHVGRGVAAEELEFAEVPRPAAPQPSYIKQVSLYLTTETHPEFMEWVAALQTHFGAANLTDTVYEAVSYAYNQLNLEDPGD